MINNIPQLPIMERTKAQNHPVWVDGTDLVNGMPIITDNHKDKTRIEEFKAAGFTPQYIQWLTVNDPRYRVENHTPVPKRSYHPKSVSYAGIKNETQVWSRGDDPIIAVIQGTSISLTCAGVSYCVCSAPAGKSKAAQARFCKAVVRSFLDEPENVWRYVPLHETPAPVPVNIDHVVENITLSPFPGPGILEKITPAPDYGLIPAERADLIEMNFDDLDMAGSYDELDQENNLESPAEIVRAFSCPAIMQYPAPVIIPRYGVWLPHLRVSIYQEVVPA